MTIVGSLIGLTEKVMCLLCCVGAERDALRTVPVTLSVVPAVLQYSSALVGEGLMHEGRQGGGVCVCKEQGASSVTHRQTTKRSPIKIQDPSEKLANSTTLHYLPAMKWTGRSRQSRQTLYTLVINNQSETRCDVLTSLRQLTAAGRCWLCPLISV